MNTRSIIVVDATELIADHVHHALSGIPGAQITRRANYDQIFSKHDPASVVDLAVASIDMFGQDLHGLGENEPFDRVCYCLISEERTRKTQHDFACVARRVNHQRYIYKWDFRYVGLNVETNELATALGFPAIKLANGGTFNNVLEDLKGWMESGDTAPWA